MQLVIHTVIRVYKDGSFVTNGVTDMDLAIHLKQHQDATIFLNGLCIHNAEKFGKSQISKLEKLLSNITLIEATYPLK